MFGKHISNYSNFSGEKLGITAQDNILWDMTSLYEHFIITGIIRGMSMQEIEQKFEVLSEKLNLDKKHKLVEVLSGGNKRKLATALTLFINPSLSFYDEPTVGLDPISRRNLLQLIRAQKQSTLFTTHRLDEAEYLCDRIAILMGGRLVCVGSSSFLKELYADDIFILVENPSGDLPQL
mmetsp:Transcript_34187/g.33385  ORF Transcript_34187/g.33385 Transcript_34187/m.33385 type:complete len:179 (+) Transcript_34187:433-969(+)